jgi:hypothetical protein
VTREELPPPVRGALERFRQALERRFGPRLREVVLFGSHARGEADDESDVDVLVVIDALDEREQVEVTDLAYQADAADRASWTGLSPLACSSAHAAMMRERERLLFRDIDREGIRL